MNNIKRVFSIKDLENLSGIKAHTIRIWEKRYNLLHPERTDTNIRTYSVKSLQKLLNITLLYNNSYKISKIAELSESEIISAARGIISRTSFKNQSINDFKLAMINFDTALFTLTYNTLISQHSFKEIFYNVFIPLLNELGLLWQTHTISPANEHFISNLIKQKILINTEKLQGLTPIDQEKTFVLYLPENEIHEIGLLFINYEITLKGYHTIYLGPTTPIENLKELTHYYSTLCFITYFTVEPASEKVNEYINTFSTELNTNNNSSLWLIGRKLDGFDNLKLPSNISIFSSIESLVKKL